MSNDVQLPRGVVLDALKARAILYTAVQEGLVDGDPAIGDGFVRDLLAHPPPHNLVEEAMEQLVIGGRILVPMSSGIVLQKSWQGELFEKGIIVPLPYISDADLVEVPEISAEIILGLANAKNKDANWSEDRLFDCIDRFNETNNRWMASAPGRNYDAIGTVKMLQNIEFFQNSGWNGETGLTEEQNTVWEELHEAIGEIWPIVETVHDYKRILTHALANDALSSLPISPAGRASFSFGEIEDVTDRKLMLKVSCAELPRAPLGRSLRETVSLSMTPAGEAYRGKMAEWAALFREDGGKGYECVLEDIRSAVRELSYSKTLSTVGEYATWICGGSLVGTTIAPPLAALGNAATVVGVVALGAGKIINYRNRWAMFS